METSIQAGPEWAVTNSWTMLSILVGSKCHYIVSRVCLFFFCNYFSFPLIKPLNVLNLSLWHEEISQVSSTLPASIFRTQACFLPGSTEVAQRFLLSWVWVGVVEGCGGGGGVWFWFFYYTLGWVHCAYCWLMGKSAFSVCVWEFLYIFDDIVSTWRQCCTLTSWCCVIMFLFVILV